MKKKLAMLLLLCMAVCFVGCGQNKKEDTNQIEVTEKVAESALEILEKAWGTYGEDEKFAAIGGDMSNPVDNAPGEFDYSDAENLDYSLGFPTDSVSLIDDCASLTHMMNANTFTSAAYHINDADRVEELIAAVKDNILARQWMCGFPDKLVIIQVGDDYVVTAFGKNDPIETFKTKITTEYSEAKVVVEEIIE